LPTRESVQILSPPLTNVLSLANERLTSLLSPSLIRSSTPASTYRPSSTPTYDDDQDEYEMVQTYGVANPHSHDNDNLPSADESRGLLSGQTNQAHLPKPDGKATMLSCVSNLCNTIIGSGMLTFPLAMASAGMLPGIITCVLSGGVAAFGLYLLSLCATQTPHRRASFHAISQLTFPRAAIFFDAAIAIKCFGVSISYLIIIKGLMPSVVSSLYHVLTPSTTNPPAWSLNGNNWITMFMLVLVPLCFLRHLHSLRHTSYIAMFSVGKSFSLMFCDHLLNFFIRMPEPGEIHLIKFTSNFISNFPVQVFAFTCAQNLFPIYNELKTNSQERMNIVIGSSIGTATITYEVIAVFGYLTFGSKVGPNIIAMYPSTTLFIAFGQLAIVVLVLFSYPLQVHPCRNCLDKVFHHGDPAAVPKSRDADGAEDEEVTAELEGDEHAHAEMSTLKHVVLTSAIIASGFTIAFLVDNLELVLSFVGATGSTTISFILPGLFYWKLSKGDLSRKRLNAGALALMIYGFCVFVFWKFLTKRFATVIHQQPSPDRQPSWSITTTTASPLPNHSTPISQMDVPKQDQERVDHISPSYENGNVARGTEDGSPQPTTTEPSTVPLTPTPPPPAAAATTVTTMVSSASTPSLSVQSILQQSQITQVQPQLPQQQVDQVDPQILEALKSKDRIFVLKLGETFEALIKESSPDRRLCDLIPPEPHTHPAIQIMRRPRSLASSVAGEEADLSDVEPSESSSTANNFTNSNVSTTKKHMTIEEREAAYKMARERIFMDFQEKPEKGKGKDGEMGVSASSSSLSLNGGGGGGGSTSASASSASAGGRSSFLGDTDDAVSSPATESEWSGPVANVGGGYQSRGEHHGNKREGGRRGGPGSTSASSSRSLRNERGFHGSGSGSSSRNSRAPSPSSSFAYPSLYEPPPTTGQIYDPNQQHHHQHPHQPTAAAAGMGYLGPANQYTAAYPYAGAPGQGHNPPFMAPTAYPYYSQPYHSYQVQHVPPHPPQGQQAHPGTGDHGSLPPPPPGSEPYSPQHQHPMNYGHPYVWGQPPPHPQAMQSPPLSHVPSVPHHHVHPTHPNHAPAHQQNHTSAHGMPPPPPPPPGPAPPPQQAPNPAGAYPGYPGYGYPAQPLSMNGFYPPPGPPHQVPVGVMSPGPTGAPQPGLPGQQMYVDPRTMNGHLPPQHTPSPGHHNPNNPQGGHNQRNGYPSPNGSVNGGRNNRNVSNGSGGGVGKNRSGPPPANAARAPWSFGPNVGGGATLQNGHGGGGGYGYNMGGGSDTNLGPRFTASHRRPSGNSSSGNSRTSSNFDDGSSIASTSTSSSSTSTNTLVSTASSQHPLPQRPDWAVGLKAQPSLAGNRHMSGSMSSSPMRSNSHNSTASSTSSNSSRHGSNHASPMPPVSMDFPPLTTGGPGGLGEKKVPTPGGAWGVPRNGILGLNGAHVDGERGPGKPGEIISPKIVRRPGGPQQPNGGQGYRPQQQQGMQNQNAQQGQFERTRDAASVIIEQVSGMTLEENEMDAAQVSTPVVASTSPAAAASLAAFASVS
ncbi:hypothetical protein CVT24_009798, partial [Panaeolus cyanescens]